MRIDSQQGCAQVIGECLLRSLVAPAVLYLSLGAWAMTFTVQRTGKSKQLSSVFHTDLGGTWTSQARCVEPENEHQLADLL